MIRDIAFAGLLLVCACSGSGAANATIAVGPYRLVPQSGFVYEAPGGGSHVVVISDQPDVCAVYQARRCAIGQAAPPPGNSLILIFNGAAGSTYAAAVSSGFSPVTGEAIAPGYLPDSPAGSLPPLAPVFQLSGPGTAQLRLAMTGLTGPAEFWAVTGSLRLQQASSTQASGSYEVSLLTSDPALDTLPSIRGNFSVGECANLDEVPDFTALCSTAGDEFDGGAVISCACGGRTATETCTAVTVGRTPSHSCDCTQASGAVSTCSRIDAFAPLFCCPLGVLPDGGT